MSYSLPIVSVCMAVYNADRYLSEAIESILNQSFSNFELLIIDDGSTDKSMSILKEFSVRDDRICLISRNNRGISKTRNEMLSQARGEFIAVMDADDVALSDRLQVQVEFLRNHSEIVCVGGAHHVIDEKGRFLTCFQLPEVDQEIQEAALAGHGSICHPTALIRRSALVQIGGYDEALSIAVDLDLWLRLGEIGQLANLRQPVLKYRLHGGSISEKLCGFQRMIAHEICQRAWQRRRIKGTFEASYPWRPGKDRDSQHYFMLQYGWWAFNSCQQQTAMIYALKAIQALPWKPEGWKLLACTLLKSPALPGSG